MKFTTIMSFLFLSTFASQSFATTGFQCHIAGKSPKRESNYLIFARLDYFNSKLLPISSADLVVGSGKWTYVDESAVKPFVRKGNMINATIHPSKDTVVTLAITENKQEGTGKGTYTVSKNGKTVLSKAIACIFDDTL